MAEASVDEMVVETAEEVLDAEIADLQAEIEKCRAQRDLHASTLLTSRAAQNILVRLRAANTRPDALAPATSPSDDNPLFRSLVDMSEKQLAHNQECLYRTCAGITTFKVRDPDPNAVDHGNVLGLRVEAFGNAKYVRPYYVFLNKPFSDKTILRVHRHTVPPCIPLPALAAKYLPTPTGTADLLKAKPQDLPRFARALRREIVHYHNRLRCVARMRRSLGLEDRDAKGKRRHYGLVDVSATDAEAMQVRLEWEDGRIGRMVFSKSGDVLKVVIIGEDGRDRELERHILGGNGRMESMAERIKQARV